MWTTALHEHPLPLLQWGVVLAAAGAATALELRSRHVPATWPLCLVVLGLCVSTLVGEGGGLLESALASALLALPYLILVACSRGGADEARLMAAVGAWLGILQGAVVLLAAGLAGFVLGLAFSLAGRRLSLAPAGGARAIRGLPAGDERVPQSPAILAGIAIAAAGSYAWL